MKVSIERKPSSNTWEKAKADIIVDGVGTIYGFSLRETKEGNEWLAPPSIKTKEGYQNVVMLNGALRAEVLDAIQKIKDGESTSIEYTPTGDTPMAVYVNPYSGDESLLAMGSMTIKNVVSVNSCTMRKKGSDMIFNMPGYSYKGKIYHYLNLEKPVFAKVQASAKEAYKAKAAV